MFLFNCTARLTWHTIPARTGTPCSESHNILAEGVACGGRVLAHGCLPRPAAPSGRRLVLGKGASFLAQQHNHAYTGTLSTALLIMA